MEGSADVALPVDLRVGNRGNSRSLLPIVDVRLAFVVSTTTLSVPGVAGLGSNHHGSDADGTAVDGERRASLAIDAVGDRRSEASLRATAVTCVEKQRQVANAVGAAGIGFDRYAGQYRLQRSTLIRVR